jgi:TP901 family phage tail tape measure protein
VSNKLSLLVSFIGADKLSGSIRNITGASKKGSIALKAMGDESRRLKRELADVGRQMQSATGNVTALINRERDLARQLEFSNRQIEQQKAKLGQLAAIERKTADRKAMASNLISSGQSDLAQGASLAAPLILAGAAAMRSEKQLALLAQKLDLTKSQTDKLGDSMMRAAIMTKQLPENIVTAADFLASKGMGQKQVERMLPVLGKFGTAWDADVTDAAKAAHANLLSLKVPLDQTSAALQIMAVAGQKGGFEVKNMAAEFPALASQMATLGSTGLFAVADLSAALQVLEAKTGDGAEAANNLNNMMRFVGSKEGIDKFKKLGIDIPTALKKAAAEGRSPLETIARLTRQATGGDDSKLGLIFSDAQALAGVRALIQSEQQYIAIRKAALNARGMTEKEFNRMSKTSERNWIEFRGSLEGLTKTLGTHLLPMLTTGTKWLGATVRSVAAWAQANPEAASTIMKIVVGLAAFKLGLGAAKIALGGIIGPFATAWGWFQKLRALGVLSKGLWLLRSGAWVAGQAIMFLGRAMLANPMIALVAGIAFAAYMIYTHWDTIKKTFNGALAHIRSFVSNMGPIGKAIVQGLISGILGNPMGVFNALKRIVGIGIDKIKAFLGIKSPSRLFMALGGHVSAGMAMGIDGGRGRAIQSAQRLAEGVARGGMPRLAAAGPPIRSAGSGSGARDAFPGSGATFNFTINALPGQDVNQLAEKVAAKIEQIMGVRRRSSYEDD